MNIKKQIWESTLKRTKRNLKLTILSLITLIFLATISLNIDIYNEETFKDSSQKINQNWRNKVSPQTSGNKISKVTSSFSEVWDNISESSGVDSLNSEIAIDSERNLHIVWEEDSGSGDYDIKYRFYNYTSQEFGSIEDVSDTLTGDVSSDPDICVDQDNTVHISWVENTGNLDIFYRNYEIDSNVWSSIKEVANTVYDEKAPAIACNSTGGVAIIFQTYYNGPPIYADKLNITYYDGTEWVYENLQPGDNDANQRDGDIFCYEDKWHITFQNDTDEGTYYILHQESQSGGAWTDAIEVRSDTSSLRHPELNIKNSKIYISWQEEVSGSLHIFAKWKNLVDSWPSSPVDLSSNTGVSTTHQIFSTGITSEDDLVVCYENSTDGLTFKQYSTQLDEQKLIISDTSTSSPRLGINDRDSFYFLWHNSSPGEIHLRKLDNYGPNLNVYNIENNSIISGTINLQSSVELRDIKKLNYSYYNGNSWTLIYSWNNTQDISVMNSTWNTNATESRLDIEKTEISVMAVDTNGLDEEIIYGNITIDNYKPQISELVNIYDELGNDYSEGDTNFTYYNGGAIHFVLNSYDNNSGSGTIANLYNNSMNNPLFIKSNTTPQEIIITSADGLSDGLYSFFINTTDRAGNWNKSNIIANIRIDNTPPDISFTDPSALDEISNGTIVSVLDNSGDLLSINFSYYISDPADQTFLGIDTNPDDGWSINLDYDILYDTVTLVANATDYAGSHGADTVDVIVDNQRPTPKLESPDLTKGVGATPIFNISFNLDNSDNDVVRASILYNEDGVSGYETAQNLTLTDANRTIYNNGTHYFLIFDKIDFTSEESKVEYDWEALQFRIIVADNQGWENSPYLDYGGVPIIFETPNVTESFKAELNGYKVKLSWEGVPSATNYLIYRSLVLFDIEKINDINLGDRLGYIGDKNLIANLQETNLSYTDTLAGPNKYYYLIITVNQYGNPSEAKGVQVTIENEELDKSIQENPTKNWIYFFLGYIGIIGLFTIYGMKRVKKKYFKKRVKEKEKVIEEEELSSFEEEEFELDAKVVEEESAILKAKEPDYISFEEEPKEEEAELINKCPSCGWVLSSTAKKCPRCGWERP